ENLTSRKPFCYVTKAGRTFRQEQLDSFAIKTEDSKQIKDRFAKQYGTKGLVEPLYNPEILASLLEVNTYHARCCDVKAKDTAGLGFALLSQVDDPDEEKKKEINDFFTSQRPPTTVLFSRMQKDYESIGYGAMELARVGSAAIGLPKSFHHIPAHTLRIHIDGNKYAQIRGLRTRWFKRINYEKDIDCDTGMEYELGTLPPEKRATEIIWNIDYTTRSDYYGLTCIAPAIGAIYGDLGRRDYNIAFFSNFGVPAYAIFITGDFDPGIEDADTKKTELETIIGDHLEELIKNPHSTLLLSVPTRIAGEGKVKIEFVPLATDIKEASFRLFRKDNKDEVVIAHGVPSYRIGATETGSLGGSTARESTEIYKRSIIDPRQVIIEDTINQEIIWHKNGFNTKDWKYKLAEIDTTDEAHEKDMIAFLFDHGAITIRGVIRHFADRFGLEDDPDDPMLDIRFVKGMPMSEEFAYTPEFKSVIKNLQNKLLERVTKNGKSDNDFRNREVIEAIRSLEKMAV
ncbi:MAG: phage portal protein, partial [Ignavibacteria bacterium]|nr:phage portal protein [Ignavibacteria bacterium]